MTQRRTKANKPHPQAFRRLTRNELTTFDKEATDLILQAMEIGCLGRVSAKGHCVLRNNAGGSITVSRNLTSPNRTAQNARADLRRLIAEHRGNPDAPAAHRTPQQSQQMTVRQAFVEHGAAFSRWYADLPEGLPADQPLEITFDADARPVFAVT
ncbi:hypothetical protein L3Q67_26565 [Saccharothrix sp. AJ9571]|nr:hypothetical protein L3Q67_26565 [Saccharothrix sp. AJ9571]